MKSHGPQNQSTSSSARRIRRLNRQGGLLEFNLEPETRTSSGHFKVPEPGVLITRDHISAALDQRRLGLMTESDLVYWATMILLNDAYEIDPQDDRVSVVDGGCTEIWTPTPADDEAIVMNGAPS